MKIIQKFDKIINKKARISSLDFILATASVCMGCAAKSKAIKYAKRGVEINSSSRNFNKIKHDTEYNIT